MKKNDRILWFAIVALTAATIFSCKKVVDNIPGEEGGKDTANSTWADRIYDSVFLYAKEIYYWNDKLPDYMTFAPRKHKTSDTLKGLQNEVFRITRFAKNTSDRFYEQTIKFDQQANKWVDDNSRAKFSYLVYTNTTQNGGMTANISFGKQYAKDLKMTLDGKENELGVIIGFIPVNLTYATPDSLYAVDKDSTVCFVRFVTKGSPAYHSGIKRGALISKINGKLLSYDKNLNEIKTALEANTISLTTYKPSTKTEKTYTINKALYTYDPFFKDTVVTITSPNNGAIRKIGYAAYKSFTDFDNSSKKPLERVIQRFTSAGIQDLVIDLRYNGGGVVLTAQNFIEYLAPNTANGKVMMTTYYNKTMQERKATILKNLPVRDDNDKIIPGKTYFDYDFSLAKNTLNIQKKGSVNLPRIYFIVSSNTASASEMLINCLKPYMDVTLIGSWFSDDGARTYGKPIGFFEVRMGPENNSFSMWISNFEGKNALGEGGYYEGMVTNYQFFDDLRYDLGDPREESFMKTIRLILGDDKYTPPVSMSRYGGAVHSSTVSNGVYQKNTKGISIGQVTKIHDMVIDPAKQSK